MPAFPPPAPSAPAGLSGRPQPRPSVRSAFSGAPEPQGLYDGTHEHDACGGAFVATLTGEASHAIVEQALTALRNLEHRGAAGAEANSGDGAGILMQVPDAFLRDVVDFTLPGLLFAVYENSALLAAAQCLGAR